MNTESKKSFIIILIIFSIMIIPLLFAQRTSRPSGYSGRGRRPNRQRVIDPNVPKINKEQPKSKKALEDMVKELEYKIEKLERTIFSLQQDKRILTKRFDEFKLLNSEEEKARIREAEKKASMTREERDIAMGYYPMFPESVYGPKKNSDNYEKGYTDGYNGAYDEMFNEADNWVYNEVDGEADSKVESEETK